MRAPVKATLIKRARPSRLNYSNWLSSVETSGTPVDRARRRSSGERREARTRAEPYFDSCNDDFSANEVQPTTATAAATEKSANNRARVQIASAARSMRTAFAYGPHY